MVEGNFEYSQSAPYAHPPAHAAPPTLWHEHRACGVHLIVLRTLRRAIKEQNNDNKIQSNNNNKATTITPTNMAMIEGMTSIDLGTSPIQETTADINDAMPDEPMETPEERSVINASKHSHAYK